jgi:hypothetical protein
MRRRGRLQLRQVPPDRQTRSLGEASVCARRTLIYATSLLLLLLCEVPAQAHDKTCTANREGKMVCPEPDASCKTDRTGEVVCSTAGGGIELNRYGDPICGPGYCAKDRRGDIFCSNQPRGAAALDRYGNAACAGECVAATPQHCVKPKAQQ